MPLRGFKTRCADLSHSYSPQDAAPWIDSSILTHHQRTQRTALATRKASALFYSATYAIMSGLVPTETLRHTSMPCRGRGCPHAGDRPGVCLLRTHGLRPGCSDRKPPPGLLCCTRERAGEWIRRVVARAGEEAVALSDPTEKIGDNAHDESIHTSTHPSFAWPLVEEHTTQRLFVGLQSVGFLGSGQREVAKHSEGYIYNIVPPY